MCMQWCCNESGLFSQMLGKARQAALATTIMVPSSLYFGSFTFAGILVFQENFTTWVLKEQFLLIYSLLDLKHLNESCLHKTLNAGHIKFYSLCTNFTANETFHHVERIVNLEIVCDNTYDW